ncbi:TonB-dependent receptor, partial [Alkalimonas collagenimarina]
MIKIKPTIRKSPLALAIGGVLATTILSPAAFALQNEIEEEEVRSTERIQVIGSRIRQDGFDEAMPVDIVLASDAASQGISDVAELLRAFSAAAGGPQATAALSTALLQEGGVGAETVSLRGLGANRTLVLLNGRRIGPAGTRGEVSSFDFNVLPIEVVDRLEILKDGASSLYGSDAVAGVINIITKKGDGGNVTVNLSQPFESGGEQQRLSATYGSTFNRGSFRVTADYNLQRELTKRDRSHFGCGERYVFDAATGERADLIDPRTGATQCRDLLWGQVWLYDYQDDFTDDVNRPGNTQRIQYDFDGVLGNYVPPFSTDPNNPYHIGTPSGWYPVGYDAASDAVEDYQHPFFGLTSLIPRNERITLFGEGDYEISDNLTAYAEVLLNRRNTDVNGYRQYWGYIYNSNFDFANFDVVEGAGNPLSQGWTGANWLSPTPITDHSGSGVRVDYYRFVAGLTGDIGNNWYWDLAYQHSRSEGTYKTQIIWNDSINDQNFATESCVGTVTSVRGVPCIDIPWLDPEFLRGNVSPAVRDFLFGEDIGKTIYTQKSLEGFISGDVFDLPAGPVGIAVGFNYQRDSINDTPGDAMRNGNAWGSSQAGITAGKDTSKAFFAEAQLPLLQDLPLAESLDLTLSGRYTDVDSSGSDTTYKAGINWMLGAGFRVRASHGTSFRAPALFELYLNEQTGSLRQSLADPCVLWGTRLDEGAITQRIADNCLADGIPADYGGGAISATTVTGGGFGLLEPETSRSNTIGFVYQPTFMRNLNLSWDYFDIKIEGEVTNLGGGDIVRQCYNSLNFATEPLCNQFDRDPLDLRVSEIRGGYLNISSQVNRGYDVRIAYQHDLSFGRLSLTAQGTRQLEASRQLFETEDPEDRTGEFGRPQNVGSLTANLMMDDWVFSWTGRYVGSVSNHIRPFR